jgi:hypothetical protein
MAPSKIVDFDYIVKGRRYCVAMTVEEDVSPVTACGNFGETFGRYQYLFDVLLAELPNGMLGIDQDVYSWVKEMSPAEKLEIDKILVAFGIEVLNRPHHLLLDKI